MKLKEIITYAEIHTTYQTRAGSNAIGGILIRVQYDTGLLNRDGLAYVNKLLMHPFQPPNKDHLSFLSRQLS